MMVYAENTKVSASRSREEIERTLTRYGASSFAYGWLEGMATIQFDTRGRRIRINLPLPPEDDFAKTPTGRKRTADSRRQAHEQALRSSWRALLLIIKAKLEAVESGVTTFEEEFLPHIVLPSGETVGEYVLPQVAEAYERGSMPDLLPGVRPALTQG